MGLFTAIVFGFVFFFLVNKRGIEGLETSMRKRVTEKEIGGLWGEKGYTL